MQRTRSARAFQSLTCPSGDLPQLLRAEQDRDQRRADEIVGSRANAAYRLLSQTRASRTRHMNKADHPSAGVCKRKIERLIAYIITRVDGQTAAKTGAAKRCRYLAARKGGPQGKGRAGNYRAGRRACAASIAVKQTQPVERPGFNAKKFPPSGEAKMQYCIGPERFIELLEF